MEENLKEYCENCKKLITGKMKDDQQVIYASAEHTLQDDTDSLFQFNDEMFSGVFCCHECYAEVSGLNIYYKKGYAKGISVADKLQDEKNKLIEEEIKFLEDTQHPIRNDMGECEICKRINYLKSLQSQQKDSNGQAGRLVGSIPNQSEHTADTQTHTDTVNDTVKCCGKEYEGLDDCGNPVKYICCGKVMNSEFLCDDCKKKIGEVE